MKPCIRCDEVKALDEFYEHPMMGDGRLNKCKVCCKVQARQRHRMLSQTPEWVMAERARGREKQKRLYGGRKCPNTPAKRAWSKRNRHKGRAQLQLRRAVLRGEVQRPMSCERCGLSGKIQAHHADYSKPLEVAWLCTVCHGIEHRKKAA